MKIDILEQRENPVFKRKEVRVRIDYEGGATPKKSEVKSEVAKLLKVDEEKVEVLKILSEFGKPFGKSIINIWEEVPEHLKKKEEPQEQKEEEKVSEGGGEEKAKE